MPKIAKHGLEVLQDAVYLYLCSLNPPMANGEQIGKALGIHSLGQPQKPSGNNPGWVTGAILELLNKAGRVNYVFAPPGKTGRYYEAINCHTVSPALTAKYKKSGII